MTHFLCWCRFNTIHMPLFYCRIILFFLWLSFRHQVCPLCIEHSALLHCEILLFYVNFTQKRLKKTFFNEKKNIGLELFLCPLQVLLMYQIWLKAFLFCAICLGKKKRSCTLSLTENGALDIAFCRWSNRSIYAYIYISSRWLTIVVAGIHHSTLF